ncbi:hypothetical protein [Halogeometricum limi]|uniref:Carboxypeptidase regulatory-like domain-containing protein n=1 Tax=Halogeometricum limi TaxID=555875 RepID=A0A1I6IE92_9EURY|nr:hypothetical protein [Halogeometricum limi]SFR65087.1 hypothetical protein SAMN04488124_3141 [Halogeometricum limi]
MSNGGDAADQYRSAVRTTSLALAVSFVDRVTGGAPTTVRGDRPTGWFEEGSFRSRRTADGYDVFLEIPPGEPTLSVDAGDRFFAPTDPVVVTEEVLSAPYPVLEVPLEPTPAYEFDAGTTLVRGVLRGPAPTPDSETPGTPIAEATVKLVGPEPATGDRTEVQTTTTSAEGEFVLYLPGDGGWTVDTEGDDPLVKVADEDPHILVESGGTTSVSPAVELRESKTTAVSLTLDGGSLSVDRVLVR